MGLEADQCGYFLSGVTRYQLSGPCRLLISKSCCHVDACRRHDTRYQRKFVPSRHSLPCAHGVSKNQRHQPLKPACRPWHQRLPPVVLVLRSAKEHRSRQMIGLTRRDALCERRKNRDLSGRNQVSATDLTHQTEDARRPTRKLSRTLLISFSSITLLATVLHGSFLSVRSH